MNHRFFKRYFSIMIIIINIFPSCSPSTRALRIEPFPSFASPSIDAAFVALSARGKGLETIPFRLRLPEGLNGDILLSSGYSDPDPGSKPRPLIVYLNGSGVSGHDNSRQLSPPEALEFFLSPAMADAIILVPQCPYDTSWDSLAWPSSLEPAFRKKPTKAMRTLLALIERIEDRYPVDKARVTIMGFSLGAFGALEAALRSPELFSKVAPMGGGTDTLAIARTRNLSFRIYHGEVDNNVNVAMARGLASTLKALGTDFTYIEIPGANHDIRATAFRDPDLAQWLLAPSPPPLLMRK